MRWRITSALNSSAMPCWISSWGNGRINRFPEMPEGDLTKIRSSLVKNERLAVFARNLDLGSALRLGRGEKSSGGHNRDNLLGSAFEALIGALYLDSAIGEKRFVYPLLEWMKESVLDEIHDPKSQLQEITQALKLGMPHYRVVNTSGPDHARIYEVEVKSRARSWDAAQAPAKAPPNMKPPGMR
jgi:ribonuclease III